jgi:tetratricopeptide (TPR) repeat protein
MPNLFARSTAFLFLVIAFQFVSNALGQQSPSGRPPMLVTWFGPGGIALPDPAQGWKPEMLTVYDNDARPVATYSRNDTGMTVSFVVFENASGRPDAQGCRDDAINPIVEHQAKSISKRADGELKNKAGETLATTSYLIDIAGHHQHDLFGFAGNAKTCAEIHVSSIVETSSLDEGMQALVRDFHPDLGYQPKSFDYFILASLLFKTSPGLAAPYYKSALDTMPPDASLLTPRRVATDQLVMSLGMSGDLKNSRAVAEQAIASDPDYPLNYYNLACADAEEGNASAAKLHLQQAFERRANVLKGETMPDPTKDDSILKLKKDQAFWAFVLSLPKQ